MISSFRKIKLSQLYTLCNLLAQAQVRDVANIRRKYLENALYFDETLVLLKDLNIVKSNSDELFISKTVSIALDSMEHFSKYFIEALFSSKSNVSEELRDYLLNFRRDSNTFLIQPTEIDRLKYSDIRNFLLELDFINPRADNKEYFVNHDYTSLFLKQITQRKLSPESLKKRQDDASLIGLTAEKAVIEYEVKRLTAIVLNPNEIQHTSLENVLAGYDIQSFENCLDVNFNKIERYIEVKAVPSDNYNFYWSRNEMETAKIFGERYFLYLLPVISGNSFNFDGLKMIEDPFNNIYLNEREWKKSEENVSFYHIDNI